MTSLRILSGVRGALSLAMSLALVGAVGCGGMNDASTGAAKGGNDEQANEATDGYGSYTSADASAAEDSGYGWTDSTDSTDSTGSTDWTDATDATGGSPPPPQTPGPNTGPNGECLPNCNGLQCGPDGCGGSCGFCGGNDSCHAGTCVTVEGCTPDCAGQMVGVEDGCGGVCSGSGFGIGLVPGGAQDAAYFRQQVLAGEVPDAALLPIEGWLNEHGTALPPPEHDRLVTLHGFVGLFYDPAEGEPTLALQLGMNSGLSPDAIEEGRFNLCVVVDRSGSMEQANKMSFVRDGLIKMLDSLDEKDTLSIVSYSTTAKVEMPPTPVADKAAIIQVIKNIKTGGKTNLWGGLKLGYEQVMKGIAQKDLTPRVILLSDGIVNSGVIDHDAILTGSGSFNQAGVGVTTIGVGSDFNFELMHLLATQGKGNFYFLDTAEKLAQVFEEEIKYLLTPVADNLKVYFSLPEGFSVEDIYGFEYKQTNGDFHLLGPTPQYTVGGEGEVIDEPAEPGDEEPNVAVATLFASKKNGLLMVKLGSPSVDVLKDMENMPLSTVHYSYELVDTGEVEAWDAEIGIGSLEYDTEGGGFHYYSGAIMQRNFCILRSGLAMKTATALYNEDPTGNLQASIQQLAYAVTFCQGINVQLNDAKLIEDLALMKTLMDNICGDVCADPAAQ